MKTRKQSDDLLGLARNLLVTSWLLSGVVLGLMLVDSNMRPSAREGPARALVKGLGLSNLSILPAGLPLRNPESLRDGVDLRFIPLLPPVETEPAGLVVSTPVVSGDRLRR
jgi:hypothetical protein